MPNTHSVLAVYQPLLGTWYVILSLLRLSELTILIQFFFFFFPDKATGLKELNNLSAATQNWDL